ncbi:MAG: archaeosine biosynthesis radical SAM protein RaSEA [Candidatus Lokiarchaeota archaeon]|nr:archaeosine biosynthesis radical SAM protein RaSEA [Candidatus Lokiarchaeota archaeon]
MTNKKIADLIQEQTQHLRSIATEKIQSFKDRDLSRPVTSWIKEDRLQNEMGYEFTIIFRTCACSWVRSDSAGCTMCGYYNDKGPDSIPQKLILTQMQYAVNKHLSKLEEIQKNGGKTTLKIFSSGSFLDDEEFSPITRLDVINKAIKLPSIDHVLAESRPEFVKHETLDPIIEITGKGSFELGIGMESSNDYVRKTLINKGFTSMDLQHSMKIAQNSHVLVKTYLLLKPPFLTEKLAIRDAVTSIKKAISWGANSISLNPVNIQAYTLTEYLFNNRKYRPPWIYSVISVFQQALSPSIMDKVLILCSPSASGSFRGVHNCHDKSCNTRWLNILNEFIKTQDKKIIDPDHLTYNDCSCWGEYNVFLEYSSI